jgi:hypothetical protein
MFSIILMMEATSTSYSRLENLKPHTDRKAGMEIDR